VSKPAVRIVSELFVEWVPIFRHKLDTNKCIVTTDLDSSYHTTSFKQSPLLIRPALAYSLRVRINTPLPPSLYFSSLYLVSAQNFFGIRSLL
jgi:hypothetical protein